MTGVSCGDTPRWTVRLIATLLTAVWTGVASVARADEPAAAKQSQPAEDPQAVQRRQQVAQLAQFHENHLTGLFHSHLELIRGQCGDLPVETRRAIVQAGQQSVKQAALEWAELQTRHMRGDQSAGNGRSFDDSVDRIASALEKALADRAGAAEAAAFAAEIAARRERRKKATIDLCVAMLDGQMTLTAATREAIGASLLGGWHDGMLGMMTSNHVQFTNGRMSFPGVPNECVVPHLDEIQRHAFTFGNAPQRNMNSTSLALLGFPSPLSRDPWWYP